VIRYTNVISFIVFGGGVFSLKLAKLCHFTTRNFFAFLRAGAHCVSQRDILRNDFWKIFTFGISEKYNRFIKLLYSDWLDYLSNQGSLRFVAID
jgi:hypothetical protein